VSFKVSNSIYKINALSLLTHFCFSLALMFGAETSMTASQNDLHAKLSTDIPKRVVITGGMPYGNKELHFGHVGGYFVQADAFARFMRDRIGSQNVLFVSGTDCYGSPIVESHRVQTQAGESKGTLEEFVQHNHHKQKEVLDQFSISLDVFAGSSIGKTGEVHQKFCQTQFQSLLENGHLLQLESTQFYDPSAKALLNGRQVLGRCPVPGCKSEKAYADECDLGHPFDPRELIAPKSTLSQETPELRKVKNWYIDLTKLRPQMIAWVADLEKKGWMRPFAISGIREFLEPPAVYLKKEQQEVLDQLHDQLPTYQQTINKNQALVLTFSSLADREKAGEVLTAAGQRFRNGKTLLPFRLTGNVAWGVPTPTLDKETPHAANESEKLASTFWVWPESLWAPLSFTSAHLQAKGESAEAWKTWWASTDCRPYQFIGEDNLYFYSLAEVGMFIGTQNKVTEVNKIEAPAPDGQLQTPWLSVSNHILFFDKKASSSGNLKPPMAKELLEHYTSDQLRAHFLALGLGLKSVGFKPKPFNPQANPNEGDTVLKEGNLLCNAFNKAVRTCFHTCQKYLNNQLPLTSVSSQVVEQANLAIVKFEKAMLSHAFHEAMAVLDVYIRDINKFWTNHYKPGVVVETLNDELLQALVDTFHMLRVATVLTHPVAPVGTEKVFEFLNVGKEFWSWDHIFEPLNHFTEKIPQHRFKDMEAKTDFFPKHPSQFNS
jgi:methionyl-tRNA synthetase